MRRTRRKEKENRGELDEEEKGGEKEEKGGEVEER